MSSENKIKRLEDYREKRINKSKKPILFLIGGLVLLLIVAFLLLKDTFKFSSIDNFDESSTLVYYNKIENNYDSIKIVADYANIYIKPISGDDIEVYIYGDEAKGDAVKNDNKLKIKSNLTCTVCHGVPSGKIILGIPNKEISNIDITTNYGNVIMGALSLGTVNINVKYGDISGLKVDDLDVTLKSGNVKLEEVNTIKTNCDMGNVTIKKVNNYAGITTNVGNVVITDLDIKKESYIQTYVGSVTIVNASDLFYACKSNLGNIEIPENIDTSKTKVKITTHEGNIMVGR